jgi:hypothetical protein
MERAAKARWFSFGFGSAVTVSAVLLFVWAAHGDVSGDIASMTKKSFNLAPSPQVSDRVHGVVQGWSGTADYQDGDQLTDIWNRTRITNGHDYPFDKGGSDTLAKMLNTEFKHSPRADITVSTLNFPPTGNFKTVTDLILTYNVHVTSK